MLSNAGLDILNFHVSLNCFYFLKIKMQKKKMKVLELSARCLCLLLELTSQHGHPSRSLMLLPAAVTVAWTETTVRSVSRSPFVE